MIGDSQTFGLVEEEDTLPRALERALKAGGGEWEVINAGVLGYGTDQELACLRRLLPVYRPDVVVLTIYPNDSWDNGTGARRHWGMDADGYLHDRIGQPVRASAGGLREWMVTHINLAALASQVKARATLLLLTHGRLPDAEPPHYVKRLLAQRWDAETTRGWRLTDSLLGEVARTARAGGAIPIFIDGASREAVSWAMWPADTDRTQYDLDRETPLVESSARRLRVSCVHVLPALRAQPDHVGLFLPNDEHWSPRGNRIVASLLAPAVRRAVATRHAVVRADASRSAHRTVHVP
jgi:hypothetical protein